MLRRVDTVDPVEIDIPENESLNDVSIEETQRKLIELYRDNEKFITGYRLSYHQYNVLFKLFEEVLFTARSEGSVNKDFEKQYETVKHHKSMMAFGS